VEVETAMWGCTFAGNRFAFTDCDYTGAQGKPGYKVKLASDNAIEVLHESKEEQAFGIRAAPAGNKVAFFVSELPQEGAHGRPAFRIRVIDPETKAIVDSERFYGSEIDGASNIYNDGLPFFHWDTEGKGLFYHKDPDDGRTRHRSSLMYFGLGKRKSAPLVEDQNMVCVAVLDSDHVALLLPPGSLGAALAKPVFGGILRLSDRKIFPCPEYHIVLGGAGKRLVLINMITREVFCARFQLPAVDKKTPSPGVRAERKGGAR